MTQAESARLDSEREGFIAGYVLGRKKSICCECHRAEAERHHLEEAEEIWDKRQAMKR